MEGKERIRRKEVKEAGGGEKSDNEVLSSTLRMDDMNG